MNNPFTPDPCETCEGTGRIPDPSTRFNKPNGEPDSCAEDMPCPTCAFLESARDFRIVAQQDHWDSIRKGEN